ncbi:MAG: 2-isopropylmalate synthase [Verrucomicrobiota bacterium]
MDNIRIFDTTLRDGEQCPGASMNPRQKMEIAHQLARWNVDVIEAGFPVISDGDFESVQQIATEIKGPIIAGLARCVNKDIDAAGLAIKPAKERGRIHVFLATSKIHREFKFKKAQDEIIRLAVEGVKRARKYVKDVEFSPEDASRTEPEFLARVTEAVISAGASTVNIPDTVGYAVPDEFGALIKYLMDNVKNVDDAIISVHCHDDLGLAVANSLAAIQNGARQVEGTINGIGERAGNVALEEVVMALKTRRDSYKRYKVNVNFKETVKTSKLVSRMSGMLVQRNKAIVGANAFAHSAGIHQDGIIKKRETYEIMDPKKIGWGETELPLTKHSGRNALKRRLQQMAFQLSEKEIDKIFADFKIIGDKKKFVYDEDLIALVDNQMAVVKETYTLEYLTVSSGIGMIPTATVNLKKGKELFKEAGTGDGAVDAAMKTIDRITGQRGVLVDYQVRAVTRGKDAIGDVTLKVDFTQDGDLVTGKAASTDVIEASAQAYLNAYNRWLNMKARVGARKTNKTKTP